MLPICFRSCFQRCSAGDKKPAILLEWRVFRWLQEYATTFTVRASTRLLGSADVMGNRQENKCVPTNELAVPRGCLDLSEQGHANGLHNG